METKIIEVSIKGVSALLMHRYPLEPMEAPEKRTKEEQAEYAAYRDDQGELFIPGVNFQRGMVSAATFSKGKGRATLQKQVAACVLVTPERLYLHRKEYTIDSRRVVVPATKGAVVRHRPRFDQWKVDLLLQFDPTLLKEKELRQITNDLGSRVGLLDFRPEKKGPFGRFMVTQWQAQDGIS